MKHRVKANISPQGHKTQVRVQREKKKKKKKSLAYQLTQILGSSIFKEEAVLVNYYVHSYSL